MAAITLANINTRVGHNCGKWDSTFLTTHVQPKVLERVSVLAAMEEFGEFLRVSTGSLTANDYDYSIATDLSITSFGIPCGFRITTSGSEKRLFYLDNRTFDLMFPKPDEKDGCPTYYTIVDDNLYLSPMPDAAYSYSIRDFIIFADANLSTVVADYLSELAKIVIIEYASADVLGGVLNQTQKAAYHEQQGDKKLAAYMARWAREKENDSGFISLRDLWRDKNEPQDDNWKRLGW